MSVNLDDHGSGDVGLLEGPRVGTKEGISLVARRQEMTRDEVGWLHQLAGFQSKRAYEADGHLSAVSWLVQHCCMSRSSAHEKCSLSFVLRARPWLAVAMEAGELSYSAAREIARIEVSDQELDSSLVQLARTHGIPALQRAVRYWRALHHQDDPPPHAPPGWHLAQGFYGTGTASIEAPNEALVELDRLLEAEVARRHAEHAEHHAPEHHAPEHQAAGCEHAGEHGGGGDHGSRGESSCAGSAPSFAEQKAEALLELVRAGAAAGTGCAGTSERYQVQVVVDLERLIGSGPGRAELLGGQMLDDATLQRITCDCSFVAHLMAGGKELLALGRRRRAWSPAQRRAIEVRDHKRCRIPGCENAYVDIHHLRPWITGGATDVSNGALICRRHHRALHAGEITLQGDANCALRVLRADGSLIATSAPPPNPARLE